MPTDRCAEMIDEAPSRRTARGVMQQIARRYGWITWVLVIGGSLLTVSGGRLSTFGLLAWGLGLLGQFAAGFVLHRHTRA